MFYKSLPPKVYTWLCGLFAGLGSIIFGYDLGVIAGVLPAKDFVRLMGHRIDNPDIFGLIASIFVLGCFAGMIPVAYLADKFGRRKTILAGAIVYIIGGSLQTGAQSLDFMLSGRFFAGFGVGIVSDLAPLYQAEIAHPSIRGRLTTLQQFMLGIGAFVASWVTYGCAQGLPGRQSEWRIPLGVQIIPALPLAAFILLLLRVRGGTLSVENMIKKVLARLHARGDENDPFVQYQIADMKASIEQDKNIGNSSWSELFKNWSNLRRVSLGVILQFSVQMTGVSAIQAQMGFTSARILLFQSINSVIALIGEACCVMWVDHTGRRLPLIIGNVASGLSFVVGSILMARYDGTVDNDAAHYIFIITTWVFNFFFSACIGPLSWAYPAEIFSTRIRAKSTCGYVVIILVVQLLHCPDLVFAILSHTNALFIWAFFPETSGRRLEEMDALFNAAPIFIPSSQFAKVPDRTLAERELREGTFVPGALTEEGGVPTSPVSDEKGHSMEKSQA
ncbi:general substrate transporter [Flagelloscypha sp. PMI_526]|nr:general substrate transporter [Flagelloscypha sp. PMI_526]